MHKWPPNPYICNIVYQKILFRSSTGGHAVPPVNAGQRVTVPTPGVTTSATRSHAQLTARPHVCDRHRARAWPRPVDRTATRARPTAVQVRDLDRHLHSRPKADERATLPRFPRV